ncbi:unnamed protein product [Tuber melanosporum]|uniref:(Perigord truffle) hypothetical protein n=1 Tax=Tuber melanosporum (strain Mel28) TaxID=656061 RepID=D5G5F3_TUBMM|nr:uncharacterized protein GSTUM_00004309001 [Tuber melanosporum]CAZ79746.1 unnamed protein product [Tuber melanosporum]
MPTLPSFLSKHNRTSATPTPPPSSASPRPTISGPLQQAYSSLSRHSSHGGATVQLVPSDSRSAAEQQEANNPSSSSSLSSYNPSSRKPLENNNAAGNNNNPGGSNHGSRLPAGLSRRLSRHQSTPPSFPQQQKQQTESDHLDPYLQQSPHSPGPPPHSPGRPQSMLAPPQESEGEHYSVKRADTDPAQQQYSQHPHPQRQDSFQNPANLQVQLQQQQQSQGNHAMANQAHNQPRRSMEQSNQVGPSREASALSQMNVYASSGRGNPNQQDYQIQAGGGTGGNQPLAYDPAKYEGQPMGRMTPENRAESRSGSAPEAINVPQLLQDHETLTAKYRKVKNLYFESKSEIERLQNTLAHQRISQSRTSLDDNEYANRFDRLDGAIKNVAFEIRQSWKAIPSWLGGVINSGAEVKGGREMTVVGRACISKWVVDEILEKFFHPALDANLSAQLKMVEHGIRINAPPLQSIEDDDALSAKVCNWRLTTLDGLRDSIHGPHAMEYRQRLSEHLVKQLAESLQMHLHEPSPPGLLGGIQMIVDIAVGLGANLPLESRDVRVWYPLPGERFDSKFMRGEVGLPPLVTPTRGLEGEGEKLQLDTNQQSHIMESCETSPLPPPAPAKDDKPLPAGKAGIGALPPPTGAMQNKEGAGKKLAGLNRVKKAFQGTAHQPTSPNLSPSTGQQGLQHNGNSGSQASLSQQQQPQPAQDPTAPKDGDRVRLAGFMACEVRGKLILVKAPVWL